MIGGSDYFCGMRNSLGQRSSKPSCHSLVDLLGLVRGVPGVPGEEGNVRTKTTSQQHSSVFYFLWYHQNYLRP